MIEGNTPVLVGVGQICDRIGSSDYGQMSVQELAAAAAQRACEDARSLGTIASSIDAVAAIRTVADSVPMMRSLIAPLGATDNLPGSVAKRIGAAPRVNVYSPACGDEPQKLLGEFAERIHAGEFRAVLLCGAEATSTTRALQNENTKPDWNERVAGPLQDRGPCLGGIMTRYLVEHGISAAPPAYALFENARRARLALSREVYAKEMGELFSRFSHVAAGNPYAATRIAKTAEQLIAPSDDNRIIAEPYTRSLVARDQVNLGAAIIIMSVDEARRLGVREDKWIYIHGYSGVNERSVLERQDLGTSAAMNLAYHAALESAGVSLDQIGYFDIYSCFPIAVFCALDALGLEWNDPRPLTLTGGLPFFGGPGNNYSMHGVAAMVERLRGDREALGVVGANGGLLSTHAVGVYSAKPKAFAPCPSGHLQARVNAFVPVPIAYEPEGWGTIETFTVTYDRHGPVHGTVIGRLSDGRRFVASPAEGDQETLRQMLSSDPLGQRIAVRSEGKGNVFAFGEAQLLAVSPASTPRFEETYRCCAIEHQGRILEVTINRPESNNALTPEANEELSAIFDAFEADDDLWIAIITGAGKRAFSTGNDLKYSASGKKMWVPKSGFGGLTSRAGRTKPIIAAVNGFAMGGGFEISLACDLVIADATAQFALSEVRVGLIAGAGGIQRLVRQIPKKIAMEMILTGRRVGADEGKALGFVNVVTPAGEALAGARALANTILECSPISVRLSMELLEQQAQSASETDAVRRRYATIDKLLASEDMMEGMMAFAEKRKPLWKNR